MAGSAESASSVFNRSRIDIRRHALKIAQMATMSPTRSDSAATSACSESDRDVISDERGHIRHGEQITRHQQRIAPRIRLALHD
jgi:hypothetical protein